MRPMETPADFIKDNIASLDNEVKNRVNQTADRENAASRGVAPTASFKIDGVPFTVHFEVGVGDDTKSFEDYQRAVEKLRAATQGVAVWD